MRMKIIFAMRSKPERRSRPAGWPAAGLAAACGDGARCRRRGGRCAPAAPAGDRRRGTCAGTGELHALRRAVGGRIRAEAAQQEADRDDRDHADQHHHQDVAELGAEAEVAHQRRDAETGGEAGDRSHPRALRRGGGSRCGACGGRCRRVRRRLSPEARQGAGRVGTLRCMPAEPPAPRRLASASDGAMPIETMPAKSANTSAFFISVLQAGCGPVARSYKAPMTFSGCLARS
jgi:hypothetical protein